MNLYIRLQTVCVSVRRHFGSVFYGGTGHRDFLWRNYFGEKNTKAVHCTWSFWMIPVGCCHLCFFFSWSVYWGGWGVKGGVFFSFFFFVFLGPPSFSWGWLEWRSHGLPTLVIIIFWNVGPLPFLGLTCFPKKLEFGLQTNNKGLFPSGSCHHNYTTQLHTMCCDPSNLMESHWHRALFLAAFHWNVTIVFGNLYLINVRNFGNISYVTNIPNFLKRTQKQNQIYCDLQFDSYLSCIFPSQSDKCHFMMIHNLTHNPHNF